MTKNNSAGHKVLNYFLKHFRQPAEACGSFTRLPDDNSTLSQNCQKWGYNGTEKEINQWRYFNNQGRRRIYRNVTVWVNEGKAFALSSLWIYRCDDQGDRLSEGDIWELYFR